MVQYYVLVKKKTGKKWAAAKVKRGVSRDTIVKVVRKNLKKGFTARIVTDAQLRSLLGSRSRKSARRSSKRGRSRKASSRSATGTGSSDSMTLRRQRGVLTTATNAGSWSGGKSKPRAMSRSRSSRVGAMRSSPVAACPTFTRPGIRSACGVKTTSAAGRATRVSRSI